MKPLYVSDFYKNDYTPAAYYLTYRSIASLIDGLKNSHRKIIYTVDKENINYRIKVSSLASKTIDLTEYLHGEKPLMDSIISLAQNFVGSNNLELLEPEGGFGTRFIPEPAAPRYIYTKKSKVFDLIFDKKDKDLLPKQYFEGKLIEPKYYLPIIPLLFVNGSIGIGQGFSQKILPRNPIQIIDEILNYLKDEHYQIKELLPWYKGFKGNIYKIQNTIFIEGVFQRKNNIVEILELPIKYTLNEYREILDELTEIKGKKGIKKYKDLSDGDVFHFKVYLNDEFNYTDEEIKDLLKLKISVVENWVCLGPDNKLIIDKNDFVSLMKEFINFRLSKYENRKKLQLDLLKNESIILSNKKRFIKEVISKEIDVTTSETNLIKTLKTKGYNTVNNSYDYLLNLEIKSFTEEKMNNLNEKIKNINETIEILSKKSAKQLWIEDLNNLKEFLIKEHYG